MSGMPLIAETRARIQPDVTMAFGYKPSLEDVQLFAETAEGKPVIIGKPGGPFIGVGKILESPSRDIAKEGWWIKYSVDVLGQIALNSLLYLRGLAIGAVGAHAFVKVRIDGPEITHSRDSECTFIDTPNAVLGFFDPLRWSNEFDIANVHIIHENPILRDEYVDIQAYLSDGLTPDLVKIISLALMYCQRLGFNNTKEMGDLTELHELLQKRGNAITAREAFTTLQTIFSMLDIRFKACEENLKDKKGG